jgi:hypothetical protein
MFVSRGEKFKEDNYFEKVRVDHLEYVKEGLKFYFQKLQESKDKKEELLKDKEGILKDFEIFKKPVAELTDKEKKQLIDDFYIFTNGRIPKNEISIESAQSFLNICCKSPLDNINWDIKYYTDKIENYQKIQEKKLAIALDSQSVTRENIDAIKKAILEFKKLGIDCQVTIDGSMAERDNKSLVNYVYSKEEIDLLFELETFLEDNGLEELRFCEEYRKSNLDGIEGHYWSIYQVVSANNKIDEVVNYIKKNHFSPFEAMIYIHKFATGFKYNEARASSSDEIGRVLPSILTSDKIVCSGYASLVKAIVDKLDMPTLKCDLVGCQIVTSDNKSRIEGHCHNLIHIKDDKYDISGYYVEDACYDSLIDEYEKGKGFAFCMYPITDVKNFSRRKYYNETIDDRLSNLLFDKEHFIRSIKNIKSGAVRSALYQIQRYLKMNNTPELVKKYGNDSTPISLEKYRAAIERIRLSVGDNLDEAREYSKKEIENSKHFANKYFKSSASNSFSNDCKKKR